MPFKVVPVDGVMFSGGFSSEALPVVFVMFCIFGVITSSQSSINTLLLTSFDR